MGRHEPTTAEGARFAALLDNLTVTTRQRSRGTTAWRGIARRLNQLYWGVDSADANVMLLGSWGKRTVVRPPTDVDLLFVLPRDMVNRYRGQTGAFNAPSRVLQLVRARLLNHYPDTAIRGDGPVVSVPLAGMPVEIVPAFAHGERFQTCHTGDGGVFRLWDPRAELRTLENSNRRTEGNTRDLIRIAKCWRRHESVPLKAFALELLVIAFLDQWRHAPVGIDDYPRMVAQFFTYLTGRAGGRVSVPGANETLWLGSDWEFRAGRAAKRCRSAVAWANAGSDLEAGRWWQSLFDGFIPVRASTPSQ